MVTLTSLIVSTLPVFLELIVCACILVIPGKGSYISTDEECKEEKKRREKKRKNKRKVTSVLVKVKVTFDEGMRIARIRMPLCSGKR
jgi:hypothetical protein